MLQDVLASRSSAEPTTAAAPHSFSILNQTYFTPLEDDSEEALTRVWAQLTSNNSSSSSGSSSYQVNDGSANHSRLDASGEDAEGQQALRVMFGRTLHVRRALNGVAWCSFDELCNRPLGAADYMALGQSFHTLLLSGVPAMSMQVRDQARRFITLVDELYNSRTRLVCSAAVPPDSLFAGADSQEPIIDLESLQFETAVEDSKLRRDLMSSGGVAPVAATPASAKSAAAVLGGAEEQFAFSRAVSRLFEMQTALYQSHRAPQ